MPAAWRWLTGGPPSGPRVVEVQPPSMRDEGTWVFLSAGLVVLCVIYIVAFERFGTGGEPDTSSWALLPYQVLFRDLPSPQQRIFREMQEGATEALAARGRSGDWPAVATLAADAVPPFAADPIEKSGLRWSLQRQGLLSQYVGVPSRPDDPAYLIAIQEPDPVTGEKAAPGVVDEEHQLLPDGRLLHVTYWVGRAKSVPAGPIPDPARIGWKQIRIKTLFEEIDQSR
jgi:hypothetical protein